VPPSVVDGNNKITPEPPESTGPGLPENMSTTIAESTETGISNSSKAAVSQPMTATNSSSSNPAPKENGTSTASPYGTRSRNRAGASRPNYAEDREMELEFEIQPSVKEEESRKIVRATDAATNPPVATPAIIAARRAPSTSTSTELALPASNISKEQIPGTSTFSANPGTLVPIQTTKKRKAQQPPPGTTNTSSTTTTANSGIHTSTNRIISSVQVVAGVRESFMLSFDTCEGHLSDGKLVADDGTVLGLNGK